MKTPSWMPLVLVGLLALAYAVRYAWAYWRLRWMLRKLEPLVAEFNDGSTEKLGALAYLHRVPFNVWEIVPGRLWRARDDNNVHGHGKTEVEAVQDMMRRAREWEKKQRMVN